MRKSIFYNMLLAVLCTEVLFSCSKYDDFLEDYEYSVVYFASQKPLRTVVAKHESDYMQIKIGVVLGGMRENKQGEWVTFEIDESLLSNNLTLLPPEYYTIDIPDNKIVISKNNYLGDFTVKINKALFTADPQAINNNYALPLRLTETSADSILVGDEEMGVAAKNYTVVAIKYIAPESGTYYVKGFQNELDATNTVISSTTVTYSVENLSRNKTRTVSTVSLTELNITGIGSLTGGDSNDTDRFKITLVDGSVTLSGMGTKGVNVLDLGSIYDNRTKTFFLKYRYQKGNNWYQVEEQMIIRQDPELDLRFEEWN